jgi:hypothetical protein
MNLGWRPASSLSGPLYFQYVAKITGNGLEPLRWLTDTLEKLPTCPNSQIDSLLPFAKV